MIIRRFGMLASIAATAVLLAACSTGNNDNTQAQPALTKGSRYEAAEKMAGCMRGLGWDITVDPDGGWRSTNGIPVAQKDQYEKDTAGCETKFGYDKPPPPLTQEQAEARYDALVAVGKCVKGLGYDTPPPPSKQKSVESMVSSGDPLWDPYQFVAGSNSSAELDKVFTKCPQP
jgi:hypothetical protein